jgi:mycoredoxin-dependent peroxiredoxin
VANVHVGEQAPDFTLKNQDNEDVTLSSFRGRPVVLVFYPLDFSGICTTELCAIRDDYQAFVDLDAVVLGISRDSRHTHKAWIEAQGLKHDLLADMKGEVAKLYGSWNEDLAFSERLTVVIDPNGTIIYTIHNPTGSPRDHHEALEALRKATSAA